MPLQLQKPCMLEAHVRKSTVFTLKASRVSSGQEAILLSPNQIGAFSAFEIFDDFVPHILFVKRPLARDLTGHCRSLQDVYEVRIRGDRTMFGLWVARANFGGMRTTCPSISGEMNCFLRL